MILNIFSYLTFFIKSKFVHKIFIKKFHLALSICNTLVYNNVDLKNNYTMDEEEIIMSYTEEVYERVVAQNPNEPEFHQAVKEVLDSLKVVIDKNEEKYRKLSILERLVEPERIISFRVPWVDDKGVVHVR